MTNKLALKHYRSLVGTYKLVGPNLAFKANEAQSYEGHEAERRRLGRGGGVVNSNSVNTNVEVARIVGRHPPSSTTHCQGGPYRGLCHQPGRDGLPLLRRREFQRMR